MIYNSRGECRIFQRGVREGLALYECTSFTQEYYIGSHSLASAFVINQSGQSRDCDTLSKRLSWLLLSAQVATDVTSGITHQAS